MIVMIVIVILIVSLIVVVIITVSIIAIQLVMTDAGLGARALVRQYMDRLLITRRPAASFHPDQK